MAKLATTTEKVLEEMFVENTGSHMLDSGGYYGRNWERNQESHPREEPETWCDEYGCYINSYHWLRYRLEYAEELDQEFHAWAESEENKHLPWLTLMQEWAEDRASPIDVNIVNTYNTDSLLTQTLQWVSYSDARTSRSPDTFVLLQVHGGCDVRGGYTKPRAFLALDRDYLYYFADFHLRHPGREERPKPKNQPTLPIELPPVVECKFISFDTDDAGYHWYGNGNSKYTYRYEDLWDEEKERLCCPECGEELWAMDCNF